MKLYKNGRALIKDKLVKADIAAERGKIVSIASEIVADDQTEVVDVTGKFILPALIDIHTHGASGGDFNVSSKEEMRKIMDFYISRGVGTVFPTVMTDAKEVMLRQLSRIAELAEEYPEIKGINLEGPFLSREFCGAMPKDLLTDPDTETFNEFQRAARGLIKIVTVAPELPHAESFIREVSQTKVVVSLGHSGADYRTAMRAVSAGAKSFTHWGNAMRLPDQHHANIAGAALLSDNYCEVIADGRHVDADVLRLVVKTKGTDKLIAITDSIMAAGLPDGNYKLGSNDVTVKDGDAHLTSSGVRAGSTLTADAGLANLITRCGIPFIEALKMWTVNPAKLTGIYNRTGSIEEGKDADFIIFGA